MILKDKRVLNSLTAIILIAVFTFYFTDIMNRPYGNDKESIVKVINTIDGYEYGRIEILDIRDINDDRVVGFLFNDHPAYIQFTKDKKGNYRWKHIEKREGESFVPFLINIFASESPILKFMIITNKENEISKMELDVDGNVIEQRFSVNQESVSWIDVPQGKSHEFKYKYFDKNGNPIGDE